MDDKELYLENLEKCIGEKIIMRKVKKVMKNLLIIILNEKKIRFSFFLEKRRCKARRKMNKIYVTKSVSKIECLGNDDALTLWQEHTSDR